ncbi:N5-carboxyaminoimidazole ribonucleotide mutase [Candidatus Burarchaeum australiense]|nr:N5-carboxyaminoimidazole ribonucleotide mutase [Candidatus Burarchaeum australiense]
MDVMIICGSKNDLGIVEATEELLNELGVSYSSETCSAHRNPAQLDAILRTTKAKVIIAIAGLSAALPGVCASLTTKPVIGVPVDVQLSGLDALLSMMQMPSGVPVATVGINNGRNAALLAAEMLAMHDKDLEHRLQDYRNRMKKK